VIILYRIGNKEKKTEIRNKDLFFFCFSNKQDFKKEGLNEKEILSGFDRINCLLSQP